MGNNNMAFKKVKKPSFVKIPKGPAVSALGQKKSGAMPTYSKAKKALGKMAQKNAV